MKTETPRIPDDLVRRIEEDVKHTGLDSKNKWWVQAAEHYLNCKKAYQTQGMHMIFTKNKGHCIKCKREVNVGEWIFFGRGVGKVCLDCSVEGVGGKAAAQKYLRMRQYQKAIKALKKELDSVADKVEVYNVAEKHQEISEQRKRTDDIIRRYLTQAVATEQEKQVLQALMEHDRDLDKYQYDLEEWLRGKLFGPRIKKKQKAYEV